MVQVLRHQGHCAPHTVGLTPPLDPLEEEEEPEEHDDAASSSRGRFEDEEEEDEAYAVPFALREGGKEDLEDDDEGDDGHNRFLKGLAIDP